ncbi:hypothetical protein ACTFIR_002594 [Dictyostelium discoideum]
MKDLNHVLNEMKIMNFKKIGDDEYTNECLMEFKDIEVLNHLIKYYGKEHMERIQKSMTQTFLYTTIRVNTMNTNKDKLLIDLSNHFKTNEKSVENQEIFTNFKSFNDILNNIENNNNDNDNDNDNNDEIKNQISKDTIFIKTIGPLIPKPIYPQIIVDLICGEAVLRGSNIFSIGVLGSNKYIKKGNMVSVFVTIDSRVSKGEILEDCFKEKCAFIGNGISLLDRDDYHQTRVGVAIEMTERLYVCPPLNSVLEDKMFLQHLPSIYTVYQLEPKLGDKIIDMCAAPGGKTTLIASLIQQFEINNNQNNNNNNDEIKTEIFALDKNKGKVKKIIDLCKRLSLDKYVTCLAKDSSKLTKENQQDPLDKIRFQSNSFDKVLLDGPCSGLGSRPRLIESSRLVDLTNSSEFQKKLIDQAVSLLKPGGILVYSTCSINPEENELNVSYLLNNYPEMKLIPQIPHISQPGLPNCGLTEQQCKLVSRFDPSDSNIGTIGFFIAKFTKIKN